MSLAQKPRRCSAMRKKYWVRMAARVAVGIAAAALFLLRPEAFDVLEGAGFFKKFSLLHLLWLAWMGDMLCKLRPARALLALGAQKQFGCLAGPGTKVSEEEKQAFIKDSNRGAAKVFVIWALLIAAIGAGVRAGLIGQEVLFLISVFFYICDLICVLVWCPFRVFLMKNRCCTTCRIFNWDHLMMFTPFLYAKGFYGWSLLGMAVVVFAVWEITFKLHPERFWDRTNAALRCKECTDRLCGK